MPIPLPSLDDHDYDDLVGEARALIPVLLPEWTDHNPGDPGIVLVELLAWLTEMQLYQVDQMPESHTLKFLKLLGGPDWSQPATGGLDAAVRQSVAALHERYRAATADDYEYLVRTTWPQQPQATGLAGVRRVRCVPGRNLAGTAPAAAAPAHVSVVVLPEPGGTADTHPLPTEALTTALHEFLDPRRILTVRHHVVGPEYVDVAVSADLALHEDAVPEDALADTRNRLREFYDPFTGGEAGDGWSFGQSAYPSEVYAVLEQSSLVDYIEDVRLTRAGADGDAGADGIALDAHQLVRLTRVDLTGYDSYGRTHPSTWELPA
ncbi:baseplate J/gp47 family protein [Streptomyces sp. NBC_01262]|uniref:baseplate J/gp47 family protein n=1 Tax=Streptomyces sp. NBC_01262 TaxID=2903803 RepID=UPI002E341551|nr:baseplate J/gp47 family protein [Streptomyces sp. NBC_01262]